MGRYCALPQKSPVELLIHRVFSVSGVAGTVGAELPLSLLSARSSCCCCIAPPVSPSKSAVPVKPHSESSPVQSKDAHPPNASDAWGPRSTNFTNAPVSRLPFTANARQRQVRQALYSKCLEPSIGRSRSNLQHTHVISKS